MLPIHELLNRIRWDQEFARGYFEVAYYDRVAEQVVRVAFDEIVFEPDEHFRITLMDEEGEVHRVPYHRIKEVYKDGALIWRREH